MESYKKIYPIFLSEHDLKINAFKEIGFMTYRNPLQGLDLVFYSRSVDFKRYDSIKNNSIPCYLTVIMYTFIIMILVTGGTGLIGSHLLLHLLENGESVRSLYRNEKNLIKTKRLFQAYNKEFLYKKIEWVAGDILDIPSLENAFRDIQYIYHCAGMISFDPKHEQNLRKVNIRGTANVVNMATHHKIKKLCYVSSVAALGESIDYETVIDENTEWLVNEPHSDYAITKYGAEMEVWRGQEEGLEVVIVNPGVVLGSGFWEQSSGKIFYKIAKGMPFYSLGLVPIVGVWDVVSIMHRLMKSPIKGERFIVVAQNSTFKNLFDCIATTLCVKKPSVHLKPWMTAIVWKIDQIISKIMFKNQVVTRFTRKMFHSKYAYSNAKICNRLQHTFEDTECIVEKSIFPNVLDYKFIIDGNID